MKNKKMMKAAILSLSLLTVMAGAAVAPALATIKEHFADENQMFVQMIVSVPAIFIVITNLFFHKLCKIFKTKTLTLIGLLFYTVGGCLPGLFDNIYIVLALRSLVGIGVGIIMPLSTGLLSYYFEPEEQPKLMGYSSAMNQMGGVVATLFVGVLSSIAWNMSFLVYLLGFVAIVFVILFLPQDKLGGESIEEKESASGNVSAGQDEKKNSVFGSYYVYIIGMFLLMSCFFSYATNFAIETAKNSVSTGTIAIVMAAQDFIAFFGGLLFVTLNKTLKKWMRFFAPLLFLTGFLVLNFASGLVGAFIGSLCVGFANGAGIPFIITTASRKAGKEAVTTVMPALSAALYLGQFLSPFILSGLKAIIGEPFLHTSYVLTIGIAVLFVLWSIKIKSED